MNEFELCDAFERLVTEHVARFRPTWRSGNMQLRYDESAAVLDRWTVTRGDHYRRCLTRGPTLAAALGIEEPQEPHP